MWQRSSKTSLGVSGIRYQESSLQASPDTSIPIRRARPVDDAGALIGELANCIHLGWIEFEIEDRHVLLQALEPGGARDHDGAFLGEKPQADLAGRLAVVRADQP